MQSSVNRVENLNDDPHIGDVYILVGWLDEANKNQNQENTLK